MEHGTLIATPHRDLDEIIEEFESAHGRGAEIVLADFLPPPDHPSYLNVLAELIRVDLELHHVRGQARCVEDYLREFPELADQPELLHEIAYEEYRLRRQEGQDVKSEEYERRLGISVGGGADPVDEPGQRMGPSGSQMPSNLGSRQRVTPLRGLNLPEVGSEFMGFRLVSELGQGAFGKVYLARQGELADRFVALKVSRDLVGESRSLAQLQHTNIVPIYSIHRQRELQAVCMPYFGSITLADVLHHVRGRQSLPGSGKDLVDTIVASKNSTQVVAADQIAEQRPQPTREAASGRSPVTLKQLENMTYVQAVLWIGARLADGLAHAHEHGILHRDLKPANVLLTADGQPMLLDFNLAQDQKRSATSAYIGGTLQYMAPEHLEAFRGGKHKVDERADIYSLGMILYELLTGRPLGTVQSGPLKRLLDQLITQRNAGAPKLRTANPAIAAGAEAIIRRCLEPAPERRYPSAKALQEDIERHLQNLPLRHAREPVVPRIGKWLRRHPWVSSPAAIAAFLGAAFLLTAATWVAVDRWNARVAEKEQADRIERQRVEGELREQLRVQRDREAADERERQRLDQLEQSRRLALDTFRAFREDARQCAFVFNAYIDEPAFVRAGLDAGLGALGRYCVLDDDDWRRHKNVELLPQQDQKQLDRTMGTLIRMMAQAAPGLVEDARIQNLLNRSGDPSSIDSQYLRARTETLAGRCRPAIGILQDVVAAEPSYAAAWQLLGYCHELMQAPTEAIACYTTAIALDTDCYWFYRARGGALSRQRDFARALLDFNRALELRRALETPALRTELRDAYINRAQVQLGQRKYDLALDDLDRAQQVGPPTTSLHFRRAQVLEMQGKKDLALCEQAAGLNEQPTDEVSYVIRAFVRLRQPSVQLKDLHDALDDLDAALKLNPRSRNALHNKAALLSETLGPKEEQLGSLLAIGTPDPSIATSLLLAANACKLNRREQALECLNEEVKWYPDFLPALGSRGIYLARMGNRTEALRDAALCLKRGPQPRELFQIAGIYALTSRIEPKDRTEAVRYLALALLKGFGFELLDRDEDLDPLRADPLFEELVKTAKKLQQTAGGR